MPALAVYHSGCTGGQAGRAGGNPNLRRTACVGWSPDSIRSNLRFLYSIDPDGVTGTGQAVTLTVRDCPPAADWRRMRERLFRQLRDAGMVRLHWVTEWQRRGVPHLHLAIYWPGEPPDVCSWWLAIAGDWTARSRGQHAGRIHDSLGWFQYVSKHAARGLLHYQRSAENVPASWRETGTGRMWGYLGDWPIEPPVKYELHPRAFHALRRVMRAHRISQARAARDWRGVTAARRHLKCNDHGTSFARGISRWFAGADMRRLLAEYCRDGLAATADGEIIE